MASVRRSIACKGSAGSCCDFADVEITRRSRDTPTWKLEAALKCRSCKNGRCAPPVHMIKLSEMREITPYVWVHPEEERRGRGQVSTRHCLIKRDSTTRLALYRCENFPRANERKSYRGCRR